MTSQRSRPLFAAACAIAVVVTCRLWLADSLPLMDTTEARFAEIARKMVETGVWLVPQHDYGVPYLAKPPLAFWLSAAGIEIFGAGELGPRLPILAVTLGFALLFFRFARTEIGPAAAAGATTMLLSSVVFFVAAAAVMTDMVLTVCVSTALLGIWRRMEGGGKGWESVAFAALGCGLIAKGPLAGVLVAIPPLVLALLFPQRRASLRQIAWLEGLALAASIAVPWYVAAEWRNPGFLRYFIVGEHLQRFLEPGWSGDLYGKAHDVPRGTIWLYLVIGALPWSIACWPLWFASRSGLRQRWRERRELVVFLLAAASAPLALFTFSGNVIFPYALPGLPPLVLAFAALVGEWEILLTRIAFIGGACAVALTVAAAANGAFVALQTQRSVIAAVCELPCGAGRQIYYWRTRYFSAEYYAAGAARAVADSHTIERALNERRDFRLVAPIGVTLPEGLRKRLATIGTEAGMAVYAPRYGAGAKAEP
jgi:4-amino-4-deoxy-L-arabinose transferase-like glycosyltransferase